MDDNNSLQIHDSEVHREAREIYTSLDELYGWFGSVGTRMTFLGWSEGVDNVKIIDEIKTENIISEVPTVKNVEKIHRDKVKWGSNEPLTSIIYQDKNNILKVK